MNVCWLAVGSSAWGDLAEHDSRRRRWPAAWRQSQNYRVACRGRRHRQRRRACTARMRTRTVGSRGGWNANNTWFTKSLLRQLRAASVCHLAFGVLSGWPGAGLWRRPFVARLGRRPLDVARPADASCAVAIAMLRPRRRETHREHRGFFRRGSAHE